MDESVYFAQLVSRTGAIRAHHRCPAHSRPALSRHAHSLSTLSTLWALSRSRGAGAVGLLLMASDGF